MIISLKKRNIFNPSYSSTKKSHSFHSFFNSSFGLAFQRAVERTGARAQLDTFDTSVVEVMREDLHAFLEGLRIQ